MYKNWIDSPSNIIRKNENVTNFNLQVDDCTEHNKKLVSDTLNSCDNFNKYFVKTRVYLLRHYPYVKTKHYIDYDKLLKCKISWNIDQDWINELKRLWNLLEIYDKLDNIPDELSSIYYNIFSSPDTIFYYDMSDEKNRVSLTAKDLIDKFGSKMLVNDEIYINDSWLIPSNKTLESWESFGKLYTNFNDFYHSEVRKIIKDYWVKNIVIVSNRSYASSFEIIWWWEITKSIKDSVDQLEKDWYLYLDYDLSWNLIKYSFDTIQVTPLNLQSIKESIDNIWIEFEYLSIEEFQNWLNKYFQQNPSLFQQFLNDPKITNHDLHIFCLANLIKDLPQKKELIKKFIYRLKDYNKSEIELKEIYELFQKNSSDTKLNNSVFLVLKDLWLKVVFDESIEKISSILAESENRAIEIKNNSIDNKIRDCSIDDLNNKLVNRWLYYYEKKSEEEIKKLEEESKGKQLYKMDYYYKRKFWINNLSSNKVNVLSANVWEWKSLELLRIKKEIDKSEEYSDYETLFYTSKTLSSRDTFCSIKSRIEKDIFTLNEFTEQNIVLFFDWIDEINSDYRKELINYLTKDLSQIDKNIKIILGSRKSEFDEIWNDNYNTLSFYSLSQKQVDGFLKSRIINWFDKEYKLKKINEFLQKWIIDEELKNTPLVLYFLTQLSIEEIWKIENRAMLYDMITLKILSEHKLSNNVDIDDCNELFIPLLWEIAFKIYKNQKIEINDKRLQKLSILFKKNWENEYQFIHNSFYEYFLAKFLSENENWNQEIYDYRDNKCNYDKYNVKFVPNNTRNEWRGMKDTFIFYGQILLNSNTDNNINKLVDFLWYNWILKNDDIFWEGFFIWLEILYDYEKINLLNDKFKKIKDLYIDYISYLNEFWVLKILKWFQLFQSRTWYSENDYVLEFCRVLKRKKLLKRSLRNEFACLKCSELKEQLNYWENNWYKVMWTKNFSIFNFDDTQNDLSKAYRFYWLEINRLLNPKYFKKWNVDYEKILMHLNRLRRWNYKIED